MVFQGLDQQQADKVWRSFLDWVARSPQDFTIASVPRIINAPARNFWDPEYIRKNLPKTVLADDRPRTSDDNVFWAGNLGEIGRFLHGYESGLPASLLNKDQQKRLVDALFASTRHWQLSLHFNKGLAGTPADAVAAAKDTAMNPAVLDAFALANSAGGGPSAYLGIPGHEPDLAVARKNASDINKAMNEMRRLVPDTASYVSESNFLDRAWRQSYWDPNYPRLRAVKKKYDPAGLFFVHHGVGSEEWSADGFTRLVASA